MAVVRRAVTSAPVTRRIFGLSRAETRIYLPPTAYRCELDCDFVRIGTLDPLSQLIRGSEHALIEPVMVDFESLNLCCVIW